MSSTNHQAEIMDVKNNFVQIIDGKSAPTKHTRNGINPANQSPMAPVPVATEEDLDRAVSAGKSAFATWSKVPFEERRSAIVAFADALDGLHNEFRDLLVEEQGKPVAQADSETYSAALWMRTISQFDLPEDVVEDNENRTIITRYTPIGVAALIVPWNYPLLLATGKIASALLTGNVVILKPSPFTPYGGLKLVELAQGFFPPGVIQSLSGDDNLGPWMTSHPGVDKISFTGSTQTGKLVLQSASKHMTRVTLELGGKDPAIIYPDVDIEHVAERVARCAFLNSGQICMAIKRIYVHESIYDKFRDAIVRHVNKFKLGDGSNDGVTHGPVQNSQQYELVKSFFDDIKKNNWKVAVGGEIRPSPGYFITPTIIDRPDDDSRIVIEEPFGPIIPLLSWKTEEEVIRRANDSTMGLAASVWSNDIEKASRVAREIQAGTVWVNTHLESTPVATFGGHKQSGLGTEWGVYGLKDFCNTQTLFLKKQVKPML